VSVACTRLPGVARILVKETHCSACEDPGDDIVLNRTQDRVGSPVSKEPVRKRSHLKAWLYRAFEPVFADFKTSYSMMHAYVSW
jgi:hypothetical protein